jgi:hypothetical protein
MRNRISRCIAIASVVLSGGYLFASGNFACGSTGAEGAISSVDMCFIFDCTNGILGGLIDPCGDVVGTDTNPGEGGGGGGTYQGPRTGPLFADCPTDTATGGN